MQGYIHHHYPDQNVKMTHYFEEEAVKHKKDAQNLGLKN